jgi:hypothetical protein
MQRPLIVLSLSLGMLSGCGQVTVFGHVVRQPDAPQAASRVPPAGSDSAAQAPGVTTSATERASPAVPSPTAPHIVKAVSVSLTPQTAATLRSRTGSATGYAGALRQEISAALRSRGLLDEHDPRATATADVTVEQLTSQLTTNAVLFGHESLSGTLAAQLRLPGSAGRPQPAFRIVSAYRWSVAAGGSDEDQLRPLFHHFAVQLAEHLAGNP